MSASPGGPHSVLLLGGAGWLGTYYQVKESWHRIELSRLFTAVKVWKVAILIVPILFMNREKTSVELNCVFPHFYCCK